MIFEILSKISGYEFSRKFDNLYSPLDKNSPLDEDNSFDEVFSFDEVQDYLMELYELVIYDAWHQYKAFPCGFFEDVYSVYAKIYSAAEEFVETKRPLIVLGKRIDNSNTVVEQVELDIGPELMEQFYEYSPYLESDKNTVDIIEDCLLQFVEKSTWQYGIKKADGTIITDINKWPEVQFVNGEYSWNIDQQKVIPVIWYGLIDEEPISRWTLGFNEDELRLDFWFKSDSLTILEELIANGNERFLIFYTEKCDRYVPELQIITEKCPIKLYNGDTTETINKKINDYFIELYKTNNAI